MEQNVLLFLLVDDVLHLLLSLENPELILAKLAVCGVILSMITAFNGFSVLSFFSITSLDLDQ